MKVRKIETVVRAVPAKDGAGVKLSRSLGSPLLRFVDPFLMLDEFRSDDPGDYIAGFPTHPHRGFETVTYMLAGSLEHRDSMGNHGRLEAGSAQWMTAGSGVLHSEMPQQKDGLLWGFQIWVNLPAELKMCAPRYQDIPPEDIPEVTDGAARVRVIAGTAADVRGPIDGVAVDPLMLDVSIGPNRYWNTLVPEDHTVIAYVFDGSVGLDTETQVSSGHLAVFGPGCQISAVTGDQGARFLLLGGAPIGEPIVQYGPFVMNTHHEIEAALDDYRSGRFAA